MLFKIHKYVLTAKTEFYLEQINAIQNILCCSFHIKCKKKQNFSHVCTYLNRLKLLPHVFFIMFLPSVFIKNIYKSLAKNTEILGMFTSILMNVVFYEYVVDQRILKINITSIKGRKSCGMDP